MKLREIEKTLDEVNASEVNEESDTPIKISLPILWNPSNKPSLIIQTLLTNNNRLSKSVLIVLEGPLITLR